MLWLVLVGRALWPALRGAASEVASIVALLFLSTVAIGLFYGAALMWDEHTHLSMVEYWRWWLVHLWVEGFFEVFATAVIAFLFTRLGLVPVEDGDRRGAVRDHHLHGRRRARHVASPVLRRHADRGGRARRELLRAGGRAARLHRLRGLPHVQARPARRRGCARYRWPIMFFLAVSFWNLVGAGLFGFLINPPLSLYYMQGLNLTPLHGHTALFGVYGMLGIGARAVLPARAEAGHASGTRAAAARSLLVAATSASR